MNEVGSGRSARQRNLTRLFGSASIVLGLQLITSGYTGCQDRQYNGTVYRGTASKSLTFAGRTDTSGARITVQRLRNPDLVPDSTAANWTGQAVTGSTAPQLWNSNTPYYDWGPLTTTVSHGTSWPLGGVLRLRTTIDAPAGPGALFAFDEDYNDCSQLHASQSWSDIGIACMSRYPRASITHVVSNALNPIDAPSTPPYLTRKFGSFAASNLGSSYYSRIQIDIPNVASTREIHSLAAFKSRFGFGSSDEVSATYYNRGDLGLGREMHCREWADGSGNGLACYVTNYTGTAAPGAPFGAFAPAREPNAIADAIARERSIATVAMIYASSSSLTATYPDRVEFLVFNGRGSFRADPNRSNEALLDIAKLDNKTVAGRGDQLPSNCVTCHGGSVSVGNNGAGTVSGAFFLPFDLQAFGYSVNNATYNRANQEEAFRKLNAMVARTNVPSRLRSVVNGWYGGDVNVAGRKFSNTAVPSGWRNTDAIPYAESLYKFVFEPYCQGCHISQTGSYAFANASDFVAAKGIIAATVCGGSAATSGSTTAHGTSHNEGAAHGMPHAEMTMYRFWNSGARAHLLAALDLRGACN